MQTHPLAYSLHRLIHRLGWLALSLTTASTALAQTEALADEAAPWPATDYWRLTVNSNQDGIAEADAALTLREAIELTNGTLTLADLSEQERQQVSPTVERSLIAFDLSEGETAIALTAPLPDILQPGLTIDGSTQPGYEVPNAIGDAMDAERSVPVPVVELTVASGAEVLRGLTVVASSVTIRGLSLYGFTSTHNATATTPPAAIFIAHRLPPPDISEQAVPSRYFAFSDENLPPQNILIEHNWLGRPPSGQSPGVSSAFGISIFNGRGVIIRRNHISHHDGSGIISGARAEATEIVENIIVNNGLSGMPDAIRLEGRIDDSRIANNIISGNSGSGIFLFKPEGAVEIRQNAICANGQLYRRAAIYLMGSDHQVLDNLITEQSGAGVVVTAFSQGNVTHSQRNIILGNRFSQLDGLSIDLNTRRHVGAQDFQRGDGSNPIRNSTHRRWETGNSAINAPQFLSAEFYLINGTVELQGQVDPGSEVYLYRTVGSRGEYGPLTEPLATVAADADGHFSYRTTELVEGDWISAIATDPNYGTSEPALNTTILSLGEPEQSSPLSVDETSPRSCLLHAGSQPAP
ncbi:MAG: right-handed parallel beta-helix repeat-containing protein [Cyanobacteria bacterium P01_D01_bin.14]